MKKTNKIIRIVLIYCMLLATISIQAQIKKRNPFQFVEVPDSVMKALVNNYNEVTGESDTCYIIFNLLDRYCLKFKDGIYSFKGPGPHFPRKVFIYNKKQLFIIDSIGAFDPKGVLQEFSQASYTLDLTENQFISYLRIIYEYLKNEKGQTYGHDIRPLK